MAGSISPDIPLATYRKPYLELLPIVEADDVIRSDGLPDRHSRRKWFFSKVGQRLVHGDDQTRQIGGGYSVIGNVGGHNSRRCLQ